MVEWVKLLFVKTAIAIPTKSGEAIPSKAATDIRNFSYRLSHMAFGHNLVWRSANNHFNSPIHQMPTANWAPFRTLVGNGGDGF